MIDRGIAVTDIIVVRIFIKNINNTIMTKIAPSKRDVCKFDMDALIKSPCRNMSVLILTSVGKDFWISIMRLSTLSVISRVLADYCFVTVNKTAF